MKNIMGINKEGNMFKVLQSFIFNILIPELAIKIPPTIEISTIKSFEKKDADKKLAIK